MRTRQGWRCVGQSEMGKSQKGEINEVTCIKVTKLSVLYFVCFCKFRLFISLFIMSRDLKLRGTLGPTGVFSLRQKSKNPIWKSIQVLKGAWYKELTTGVKLGARTETSIWSTQWNNRILRVFIWFVKTFVYIEPNKCCDTQNTSQFNPRFYIHVI